MKISPSRIVAWFLGLILAFIDWAFWLEPASLYNETYELALPAWPERCDGIRIAALADLHVGSPFNHLDNLRRVVDVTMAAKPDLILLLGDFITHGVLGGSYVDPEKIAEGLTRLSAPLGVFAVLGNHDHWDGSRRIVDAFRSAGISFLDDDWVSITWKQCEFSLVGLSDFLEGQRRYSETLAKVPKGKPAIGFTHNPDVFPLLSGALSLVLAAHTHGGQVYLPFVGRPIVPSRYGQRFAAGHIVEGSRHLFVSSGIGTSILPVRFLVPPEVSILVLRARPTTVIGQLRRTRTSHWRSNRMYKESA